MSYSTLMVHLDIDGPNEMRLKMAGELAERFGSRVIGIAAADIRPPLYFAEGEAAQALIDQERDWIRSRLAACEAEFRSVLQALSGRIEWRSALGWPADFVARNARAADLVLVGSQTGHADATRQIDPGDLVMRA